MRTMFVSCTTIIIAERFQQACVGDDLEVMQSNRSTRKYRDTTVWGVHLSDATKLTKEERQTLLFKLNRLFTFVGAEIPEEVELDGQPVPLHEVMWRLINHRRELTPQEFEAVQSLYVALERKIKEDESAIRSQDIDEREAIALYLEAQGLIRAAVELRDAEKGKVLDNYAQIASSDKIEAQKIWLSYLKKIR
jgi:hypothetical protein